MMLERRKVLLTLAALSIFPLSAFEFTKFDERRYVADIVFDIFPELRLHKIEVELFSADFITVFDFKFFSLANKFRYFIETKSQLFLKHENFRYYFSNQSRNRFLRELVTTSLVKSTNIAEIQNFETFQYFGIEEFKIPGTCSNRFARFDFKGS